MADLDVEALKRLTMHMTAGKWWLMLDPAARDAIIAALEDRDRLRATVSRIDAVVERMYLPPEFAHFQAELSRILTLEGRDG